MLMRKKGHAANVPAGSIEQNNDEMGGWVGCRLYHDITDRCQLSTKRPVRITSRILAGIRADKYHYLTFPCRQAQWYCKIAGSA